MNYLKQNLDNSAILPYDIMLSIYQYADPLYGIRRQIENKEYDLDNIMYEKMKQFIQRTFINKGYRYALSHPTEYRSIFICKQNINDISLKDALLNYSNGYKHYFLWKSKNIPSLCGIEMYYSGYSLINEYFIYHMREQVQKINKMYYNLNDAKEIYKLWRNL